MAATPPAGPDPMMQTKADSWSTWGAA